MRIFTFLFLFACSPSFVFGASTVDSPDHTLRMNESIFFINPWDGVNTVMMPKIANAKGRIFTIKYRRTGKDFAKIVPNESTSTIDGMHYMPLNKVGQVVTLTSNGNNWEVLTNRDIPPGEVVVKAYRNQPSSSGIEKWTSLRYDLFEINNGWYRYSSFLKNHIFEGQEIALYTFKYCFTISKPVVVKTRVRYNDETANIYHGVKIFNNTFICNEVNIPDLSDVRGSVSFEIYTLENVEILGGKFSNHLTITKID